MSDLKFALGILAFAAGIALLMLAFSAGVAGLALWYEHASIACPDGQVHVTTDTIRGCMPWEEVTNE